MESGIMGTRFAQVLAQRPMRCPFQGVPYNPQSDKSSTKNEASHLWKGNEASGVHQIALEERMRTLYQKFDHSATAHGF
jgi:hypothetical protein